jgi:hypothetical protein
MKPAQARKRQVVHQGRMPRPPRWAARMGQGMIRAAAAGRCTSQVCLLANHASQSMCGKLLSGFF